MPHFLPLAAQTMYAELVQLCGVDAFDEQFPPNGSFVKVTVKQRDYWYYQHGAKDATGRQPRKSLGPDNPQNAALVARHGATKTSYRQRRSIVAALRSFGMAPPPDETGELLRGLAAKGVFRLRACVVGTVAYQTYAGILGARLPSSTLQTGDLDIAQSRAVSMAIGEEGTGPAMLELLKGIDPSFRAISYLRDANVTANYVNERGYRVEFLTDNRGPDRDDPILLPALHTHARPLRYMDYLLRDAIPAAVLWDGGIGVNVPRPERYAIHKLIVAQLRTTTSPKRDKDLQQASALFDVLAERRAADLSEAWTEAFKPGPRWRRHLLASLARLDPAGRDRLLYATKQTRAVVPDLDIEFRDPAPHDDFGRDVVVFVGIANGIPHDCAISRAALDDWFGADGKGRDGRVQAFRDHRVEIQAMARMLYRDAPVPADGSVLIRTGDVPRLRKGAS